MTLHDRAKAALEALDMPDWHAHLDTIIEALELAAQPAGDLVRREDVLRILNERLGDEQYGHAKAAIAIAQQRIADLPAAQPAVPAQEPPVVRVHITEGDIEIIQLGPLADGQLLYAATPERGQGEPVAWRFRERRSWGWTQWFYQQMRAADFAPNEEWEPLYAAPPAPAAAESETKP